MNKFATHSYVPQSIKLNYYFQPSVRKTHCSGRKHKENVKFYYQKWMEDQAQNLIDATSMLDCTTN